MRLALATVLVLAVTTALAVAVTRPPPSTSDEIRFSGTFRGSASGSSKFVEFRLDPAGAEIWEASGDLPAKCRGAGSFEKGIAYFTRVKKWAIRPDGTFTVRQRYNDGGIKVKVRVTGEFRGNRVSGVAEATERSTFSGLVCAGKRRFRAHRVVE